MTLPRIEPATFRLEAQCVNKLRHCVPRLWSEEKILNNCSVAWINLAQVRTGYPNSALSWFSQSLPSHARTVRYTGTHPPRRTASLTIINKHMPTKCADKRKPERHCFTSVLFKRRETVLERGICVYGQGE